MIIFLWKYNFSLFILWNLANLIWLLISEWCLWQSLHRRCWEVCLPQRCRVIWKSQRTFFNILWADTCCSECFCFCTFPSSSRVSAGVGSKSLAFFHRANSTKTANSYWWAFWSLRRQMVFEQWRSLIDFFLISLLTQALCWHNNILLLKFYNLIILINLGKCPFQSIFDLLI